MRTPSPLVGRDKERAVLLDALAQCSTGSGGLVLVSGETGVGKSRLVTEALEGFAGRRVQVTAVAGARAYAPLMAAVGGRGTTMGASWYEDPTGAVEVACRALASGGPTAVVLDDLHQADAATIEVLPALAVENLTPEQVAQEVAEGALLVDLREPAELHNDGAIDGAVHAPRGMLEFYADPHSPYHREEFDPTRRTILYCASGGRSALATVTLAGLGYTDVAHLDGGIKAWRAAGRAVAAAGS